MPAALVAGAAALWLVSLGWLVATWSLALLQPQRRRAAPAPSPLPAVSVIVRTADLVSIAVTPPTQNIALGRTGLLTAKGTFTDQSIQDITNQVIWTSNTPDMVMVNSTGLITATGRACGGTIISATVTTNHSSANISSNGAIVTGTMQANVVCFTGTGP